MDCDQELLFVELVAGVFENQSLGDFNDAQPTHGESAMAISRASLDLGDVRTLFCAILDSPGIPLTSAHHTLNRVYR
jgi:hypothetical protein